MVIASGIYTADAGCLKVILNGGSSVLFNNDYGDGDFTFIVADESTAVPDGARPEGCLQITETAFIVEYDCGARVAATLEPGSYIIEAFEGTVYIIKVGEDGRLWGKNEPVF